jgi:hypothetical protein
MDGDYCAVPIARRRRALRRAVALTAEVTSSASTHAAKLTITNLSERGMWLRAEQPACVGDELSVSFRTPRADNVVCARVRVVRVAESCGCELCAQAAGMGVCFLALNEAERAALESSLRGLPPPLPRVAAPVPHVDEPGAPIIPACALMTSILTPRAVRRED